MKPKYSPYNKLQRNPSILAVSILISHHCLCEFVTLGTPTAERQEHDRPDTSAASLPLQAESAQESDLKIVMYSVCPVQGMQTALQVLFTARKKGIISGMGNEPCAPWKGIGSAGRGLFSLKAAMGILLFCPAEITLKL